MSAVIIAMTNIGAKLINADSRAISIVTDTLSYDVEGAEFTAGFKMGSWNGKKSFLKWVNGSPVFQAGFVKMVQRALNENGIVSSVHDMRAVVDIKRDDIKLQGIELRDYQIDAIAALEREGRGILQCATGAGKTEIAIAATQRFGVKTLFLTHKLDLVRQTRKRYKKRLGRDVGMISEGEWLPSEITVATVQTIMSHWRVKWHATGKDKKGKPLNRVVFGATEKEAMKSAMKNGFREVVSLIIERDDRAKVENFLAGVEFLVVDEAHRSSANSFFKIIGSCTNAFWRASLTATPLMKGNREDDLKLIACSGDVIYRITNSDLIKLGVLAEPHFQFHEVPSFTVDGKIPSRRIKYPTVYKHGVVENQIRNMMVVEDTQMLIEEGRPTVVLVKEIKHGDKLLKLMREKGMRVEWVAGKDSADVREEVLKKLSSGEIDAIIASTILDEGLDNDSIAAIVLAGGGKSKISLFQRVGRSVRAKKGEMLERIGNTAKIIDYIDTGDERLKQHSAERYATVKYEEGWVINGIERWSARQKRYENEFLEANVA